MNILQNHGKSEHAGNKKREQNKKQRKDCFKMQIEKNKLSYCSRQT